MLVDLGRNDIGRISKIGTVEVEKYMSVEHFSQVMHIGSTVAGELREDKDAIDAVDAILTGRNSFRSTEIQGLPDHRRTGTEQTRHLWRRDWIS